MEEVGQRINQLITYLGLSNSEFADQINLPRPILSHILSGRNKPSLLVVQKIAKTYDEININWLLLGKGEINSQQEDVEIIEKIIYKEIESKKEEPKTESKDQHKSQQLRKETISKDIAIENIVHYYTDGTFKVFTPRDH